LLFARETSGAETSAEGDRRALYSPSTWHKKADALSMKTTKRIASQADATDEQQLAGFIKKFDSKNAALIRSVRKVLRERLPTANELVYDNYNFFVIGYCSTERPSDCVLSIAAGANGVGLSFYYGATLPDPHKLLLGSGNQNRFIRIESAATLARPEVEELIAAGIAQAEGRCLEAAEASWSFDPSRKNRSHAAQKNLEFRAPALVLFGLHLL
jgi:hypothetical protein